MMMIDDLATIAALWALSILAAWLFVARAAAPTKESGSEQ